MCCNLQVFGLTKEVAIASSAKSFMVEHLFCET